MTKWLFPSRLALAFASLALASCQTPIERQTTEVATLSLRTKANDEVGNARVFQQGDHHTINVSVRGLPAGEASAWISPSATCFDPPHMAIGPTINRLPDFKIGREGLGTLSAELTSAQSRIVMQGASIVVSSANGDGQARILACGMVRGDQRAGR